MNDKHRSNCYVFKVHAAWIMDSTKLVRVPRKPRARKFKEWRARSFFTKSLFAKSLIDSTYTYEFVKCNKFPILQLPSSFLRVKQMNRHVLLLSQTTVTLHSCTGFVLIPANPMLQQV